LGGRNKKREWLYWGGSILCPQAVRLFLFSGGVFINQHKGGRGAKVGEGDKEGEERNAPEETLTEVGLGLSLAHHPNIFTPIPKETSWL